MGAGVSYSQGLATRKGGNLSNCLHDRYPLSPILAEGLVLVVLLLLALALRLPPLLHNPLHADEALYATWGQRIATGQDPWLLKGPVFKPPLWPYLLAGSFLVFGVPPFSPPVDVRFVARLPGLMAGLLSVALVYRLGGRLYGRRAGMMAALVMTLSPFAILFSATAFTDPLMVALGLAGVVAAVEGRGGWAGLGLGLSAATKQQGLIFLPLALVLGLVRRRGRRWKWGWWRGGLGLALILVGVLAWDVFRVVNGGVSFWAEGWAGYGGLRFAWSVELLPRLRAWLRWLGYFFASPLADGLVLVGVGWRVWRDLRRPSLAAQTDLLLLGFGLLYLLAHWLVAFPVWDRYLLPLVPIVALLVGRLITDLSRHRATLVAFLGAMLLWEPAMAAAWSLFPVGSDHGAYDGLERVIYFLRAQPRGTVFYDRWAGWHYDLYLFDGHPYRAYAPHPAWLARDLTVFYREPGASPPRYLVVPGWAVVTRWRRALTEAGFSLVPVLVTANRWGERTFTVYRITTESPLRRADRVWEGTGLFRAPGAAGQGTSGG
ncbi:MAG TPA: hypothetical protein ENK56_09670 [Chloroflexi bacterium]|nr:hypothetical protein [Chloroflexota bacterium]